MICISSVPTTSFRTARPARMLSPSSAKLIRSLEQVAIGRVVLTNREHVIALEARGKGLMGMLLRYPYEVRDESEYFDDIQDVKISKDMMDLAQHIVKTKTGHFEPEKFEDHYETALKELVEKKMKGIKIGRRANAAAQKVNNLMDALRRSVRSEEKQTGGKQNGKRGRKRIEGQKEMLFPIAGSKKPAKEKAKKSARAGGRRKAG